MKKFLRIVLLAPVCLLTACAYVPPKVTVYGGSGATFIAPDLCAAIVACKKASEPACYYNATVWTSATGDKETSGCKLAK